MPVLTLPLCPSANRYWRTYRGRAVKSPEARNYRAIVAVLAKNARMARIEAPAPIAVSVTWERRERRGDLDNRLKVLLDALQGVAYDDDKQITELHAYLRDGFSENRMLVSIQVAA